MVVNLDWVLRPNFGRAVAGNVEQARIRMRYCQTALFNAVAEDHRVQSHAYSYRYCVLYPGQIQIISARAPIPPAPNRSEDRLYYSSNRCLRKSRLMRQDLHTAINSLRSSWHSSD